jgi:hypothetical protein
VEQAKNLQPEYIFYCRRDFVTDETQLLQESEMTRGLTCWDCRLNCHHICPKGKQNEIKTGPELCKHAFSHSERMKAGKNGIKKLSWQTKTRMCKKVMMAESCRFP